MPPGADVMTKDPIAPVQKSAQAFQLCKTRGLCGLEKDQNPLKYFL